MWELLGAIFGGAFILSKIVSDKASQQSARQNFEKEQYFLTRFRNSVTNERMVQAVKYYMSREDAKEQVAKELRELFLLIPELKGLEKYWNYSNHRPPASNWDFVELILCINRGCVPLTKQFAFAVSPYYIGNNAVGTPRYVAMSEASRAEFADWVVRKLETYGVVVDLKYDAKRGYREFVWRIEP